MNFESLIHHHGFFLIVGEWHNYPIHILSYETCDCTSALRWEAFTSMSGSVQTCGQRHTQTQTQHKHNTHTHTHTNTLRLCGHSRPPHSLDLSCSHKQPGNSQPLH